MENKVKYEFIKNGTDNWTLKYKDNSIDFHSNVEIIKDLQDVYRIARRRMIKDLAKDGMTIQDLVVVHENGSKTIEDRSNVDEYEKDYINQVQTEIFNNVCLKLFNKDYITLATEIGLENDEEAKKLGEDIGRVIRGETPRR